MVRAWDGYSEQRPHHHTVDRSEAVCDAGEA